MDYVDLINHCGVVK